MGESRWIVGIAVTVVAGVLGATGPARADADAELIWQRPFVETSQGEEIGGVRRDDDTLLFWTEDSEGRELVYRTDGTRAGTTASDVAYEWIGFGGGLGRLGRLSVFVRYGDEGPEPWVSDGTREGTRILKDVYPGTRGSYPRDPVVFQDRLYFAADDPDHGEEIWVTDGTPAGTSLFRDNHPGPEGESRPVAAGSRQMYFSSTAPVGGIDVGVELWATDGSQVGTRFVADVAAGADDSSISDAEAVVVADGATDRLYAAARTDDLGRELWTSDGTAAGTRLVVDARPGPTQSSPRNLFAWRGAVYFVAEADRFNDLSLWRTVGASGATRLSSLRDVVTGDVPTSFRPFVVGGVEQLFFAAPDGTGGHPLWRTDGTATGTRAVQTGFPSRWRVRITGTWRSRLVLSAGPEVFRAPPFISDLTPAGTYPLARGSTGENWQDSSLLGDRLLGIRKTTEEGDQLLALALPDAARRSTTTRLRTSGSSYGAVVLQATSRTATGTAAPGTVTFRADGRAIGTVRLVGGTATFRLPASVMPGTRSFSASYAGSGDWRASTASTRLSVVRTSAVLDARGPRAWTSGKRPRVRIRLDAPGTPTRGTWQVRSRGRVLASGTALSRSRTEVKLPRLRTGRHRLVVRWSGSATTTSDADVHVLRVRRR